jgi:hypothetical protein
MFYLSRQCQMCHNCKNFWQHIEILWKKVSFHLPVMDTDQDRPDPNRNALDVDTDPNPAKWCGSDPIRMRIHNIHYEVNIMDIEHEFWLQ